MDLSHEILKPKLYVVLPVHQSIIIDGQANENVWQHAPWSDNFIDIEGIKTPKLNTRMKMLWGEQYLYIYAELEEPHVSANITQHDTVLFHDNVFEVFIDHNDDTYQYIELEINAKNTTWDLFLDRPYRNGGVALNEYEIQGLQHAVHVDGKLNEPTPEDKGWSVELAIPIATILKSDKNDGQRSDYFRMNFTRVQWGQEFKEGKYRRLRDEDDKLKKPHYSVWSSQGAVNMHQPEMWGYVYFSNEDQLTFNLPDDYCDRQVAYACLRQLRQKPWRKWKKSEPGYKQAFDIIGCADQKYLGSFNKTDKGFELLIKNKAEQRSYVIDQDGRLQR